MIEAHAVAPNIVHVPAGAIAGETWWCRAETTPAAPVRVVAERRKPQIHELVLDQAMTQGGRYSFGTSADEVSAVAFCTAPIAATHRCDLWKLLPQYNRSSDSSGDLRALMGSLQDLTDILVSRIDQMVWEFDVERAGAASVAHILEDLGNPFRFQVLPNDARRLATLLVEIYQQKGTARGIQNAIRLFLGLEAQIDCRIVTEDAEGFRVGDADPSSLYTFDVVFDSLLSASEQQRVRSLVDYLKPAHTHLGDLLFPNG